MDGALWRMIEGDAVPLDHVLARYCKACEVINGEVQGPAFMLTQGHDYLSVTSLNDVAPDRPQPEQVGAARSAVVASGFTPKKSGWFVLIRADVVARPLTDDGSGARLVLETLCHPEPGNASHCGIHGLPPLGSPQATSVGLEVAGRVTEPVYSAGTLVATPARRLT